MPKGEYKRLDKTFYINKKHEYPILSAVIEDIEDEPLKLSSKIPTGFFTETMLKGPKTSTIH